MSPAAQVLDDDHRLEKGQEPKPLGEKNSKNATEESSLAHEGKLINSGSTQMSPDDVQMHGLKTLQTGLLNPEPAPTAEPNTLVHAEIENCKGVFNGTDHNDHGPTSKSSKGRWTDEEHNKFLQAIRLYGKDWRKVQEFIGTRTGAQIRSHAQKYFITMVKQEAENNSDVAKLSKE